MCAGQQAGNMPMALNIRGNKTLSSKGFLKLEQVEITVTPSYLDRVNALISFMDTNLLRLFYMVINILTDN